MRRPLYMSAGLLALGVGFIGIFLPLLPTTPFVLLAAFCFARANPAWEARLLADPRFGPSIIAWRERGAIPAYAKRMAIFMMALSSLICWFWIPNGWHWTPAATCSLVAVWMLSRPSE